MARIAVIGAGIGGLSFAAAMRNSRHDVIVYEQANELTELGAGISLWANGTRLFAEMGIASSMAQRSCETEAAYFRNEDGSVAASQRLARDNWYRQEYGSPYYGAFRTDLQAALLDVVGRENIRLGKQLTRLEDTEEEATLFIGLTAPGMPRILSLGPTVSDPWCGRPSVIPLTRCLRAIVHFAGWPKPHY